MDTKEDRLAIARRENQTGPTPGKTRRYGKRQGNLQKTPIVGKPASRAVSTRANPPVPTPGSPSIPAGANGSQRRPKLPRIPS